MPSPFNEPELDISKATFSNKEAAAQFAAHVNTARGLDFESTKSEALKKRKQVMAGILVHGTHLLISSNPEFKTADLNYRDQVVHAADVDPYAVARKAVGMAYGMIPSNERNGVLTLARELLEKNVPEEQKTHLTKTWQKLPEIAELALTIKKISESSELYPGGSHNKNVNYRSRSQDELDHRLRQEHGLY